jgi:chaperone required for assembly of F1-ATPase
MSQVRRFWQQAEYVAHESGYALTLDGQLRRTPAGKVLSCPTLGLAQALVAEWQSQPEQFDPRLMGITQLVATAHDITTLKRDEIVQQVAAYALNDLLCCRTELPLTLAQQQADIWQPYLDWAEQRFSVQLNWTNALQPAAQSPQAVARLQKIIAAYDVFQLTVLEQLVSITGSLILALALMEGWRDAAAIHQAAELETLFQMEQWGEDEAARERLTQIEAELISLAQFLAWCRA